ncbi:FAD-binding protein [Salibacterium sp. K-3]
MNIDVLVVGGGVSGLRSAIKASEEQSNVTLITKGKIGVGSETAYLDHLIELTVLAVSETKNDHQLFISDLLNFGQEINNKELVNTFVESSREEYQYLQSLGVPMENDSQTYPSHRAPRLKKGIGHFGENLLNILKNEAIKNGVNIIENAILYDVESTDSHKLGHVLLRSKGTSTELNIGFTSLILATGGTGQLFSVSTNPSGSTGDGVGFALSMGAKITNLEFLHFLPLLVHPINGFYIVSSIFTKGYLFNSEGEKFEPDFSNHSKDLKPAELQGKLISQACQWIQEQILAGKVTENKGVYWNGKHLEEEIYKKMPKSYEKLKSRGLDLLKENAEMTIGCHQMLGGVQIDNEGRTTIPWLFAAGEVAGGFQGAERLMGTGVMDGLVFGSRAGKAAAKYQKNNSAKWKEETEKPNDIISFDSNVLPEIKQRARCMMDQILITKDEKRLLQALEKINDLYKYVNSIDIYSIPLEHRVPVSESKNLCLLAAAFIQVSLNRKETRGSFIRNDYPFKKQEGKPSYVSLKQDISNLDFQVEI